MLIPAWAEAGDCNFATLAWERDLVAATVNHVARADIRVFHPPANSAGVPVGNGLRPTDAQFHATRRYLRA